MHAKPSAHKSTHPHTQIYTHSNVKFHDNPSAGNRVVPCGQTDMTKVSHFRKFSNVPNKTLKLYKGTGLPIHPS